MIRYTAGGFRLRVVGANPHAARSAGQIDVERVTMRAFLASGALAGLAGAIEVCGVTYALYENISPGYGYTAIAVALLARLNAAAVIVTGIVFGALEAGGAAMQRDAGVPSVVVSVVEAGVILALVVFQRARIGRSERDRRMSSPRRAFLEATVRTATPLALAALGEVVVERAGIINISLEGVILSGAFGALVGATQVRRRRWIRRRRSLSGVAIAIVFALFVVRLRADQIITGTAVTLLAVGLTGTLYRTLYGAIGRGAFDSDDSVRLPIPGLVEHSVDRDRRCSINRSSRMSRTSLVPLTWWWMYRTHAGLALRAVGESPARRRGGGHSRRIAFALARSCSAESLAALAGATLVLAQAGTFAEGMSAGRGFIAIAIVVLGRWHPLGVALAALVFGAASALQFLLQALGLALPYQLFLALPYVLTLAALAGVAGRVRAPAALARVDDA